MGKTEEDKYFNKIGKAGLEFTLGKPFSDLENVGSLLSDMAAIFSLMPKRQLRIADMGCGSGWTSNFYALAGHDVVWAGDWPKDPGDEEILAHARSEGRVLVTLDKDFCELAVLHGMSHCGILRLVNISARQQAAVCQRVLIAHGLELASGAIVTAEAERLRIRLP